jgi:DNA-binding NtrC family response regulator
VFPIEAPSLRERLSDVPALVEHFIRRFNVEEGKRVMAATPETLAMLGAFDWPGNVRQLENAVYRAMILADGPYLQPHDFPAISGLAVPPPSAQPALAVLEGAVPVPMEAAGPPSPVRILDEKGHLRTLEEIERDLIQLAIEIYAGHMSEVARRLGIGRSTLYRKVASKASTA